MRIGEAWVDVCIRNMSSRGLLVETAAPPPRGTYVEIRRATHVIVGRSMWRRDGHFGVRTQDRLDVDAIVTAIPHRPQAVTADGRPERRDRARIAQRAEHQRRLASALQFVSIVAIGLAAAAYAAVKVYDLLSTPAQAIEQVM